MAIGIIFLVPVLIVWFGNISLLLTLDNWKKILLNNVIIIASVFGSIFILTNIGARLPLVTFGVLFFLLHPVVLFLYLISVRNRNQKPPPNEDILDEDFKRRN